MSKYITREEICAELNIELVQLRQYEQYLEIPEPEDNTYHISVARTISRLHELISNGMTFNDVRYLSFCAEHFKDIAPSLRSFEEFSPKNNLKELSEHYQKMLREFSLREDQYKNRIHDLEESLEKMHSELEDNDLYRKHLEQQTLENERLKLELQDKESQMMKAKLVVEELEYQLNELAYQNAKKENSIAKLESKLDTFVSANPGQVPKTAINIDSLLKKKEKEIEIKHQRRIFDLKKQVESLVEQKEKEWSKKVSN